jgi:hypothetical protein
MHSPLADLCSNLHGRIHYHDIRHRNGLSIHQVRTVCSTRQVEHNDMHRGGVIPATADVDANHRVAHVQPVLWQPHLVPDAIRPTYSCHFVHSGLLLPVSGRCY